MNETVTYADLKSKRVVVPLEDLVEWEDNYKYIEEEDFEQLKSDVAGEPFKPSITTPREDGKLITLGGNQRLKAKKAIGKTQEWVSIITFEQRGDSWVAFVNGEIDLDKDKKPREYRSKQDGMKHYALKDNEERGKADLVKLPEWAGLSGLKLDEYKIGTESQRTLKSIVDEVSPTQEEEEPADNAPRIDEEIECPRCHLTFHKGETWHKEG